MRTYRELFRAPEFTPFFLTASFLAAAQTVSGLALGTLIYDRTGSPLLSSLGMFGPALAQVVGAAFLLSAADRLPPRGATAGLALFFALATAAQALPGLPLWATFALLLALGSLASLGGGVRYGLLNEILSRQGYLIGRSVINMSSGTMQICGYGLGGALVAVFSPRGTLLAGAALYLAAAIAARVGLTCRAPRAAGRPSIGATWRTNALLWSSRPRRSVYLALWVPNGLIVGCESLYVPFAPERAGLLFAFAAFGMLAGDVLAGRFLSRRWRERLGAPLRLLLALPYLVFVLRPGLPLALMAVTLASVGFSAGLLLQEQLMALTPDELSGHALGLHTSGMLTMQGVGAALGGGIAQLTSAPAAMTVLAMASVAVTLALAPGLRSAAQASRSTAAATRSSDAVSATRTKRSPAGP
ncbi:MFS transporter [Streptomyces sp. NPDC050147]|uniref:MFS transporter n=1 Tax=Streptomyces sp. NPDC050147 TaxID=3155513 RepID=UPI0034295617